MKYLALVLALMACPANAAVVASFTDKPDAVSAKLATRCIDKGRTLGEVTPMSVTCIKPIPDSYAAWLSFTAGISMMQPATLQDRYVILPNGEGSKVQATSTIEAFRKNGMPWSMPIDRKDNDASFRQMLTDIGGALQ